LVKSTTGANSRCGPTLAPFMWVAPGVTKAGIHEDSQHQKVARRPRRKMDGCCARSNRNRLKHIVCCSTRSSIS
jgi:hypothetical protein